MLPRGASFNSDTNSFVEERPQPMKSKQWPERHVAPLSPRRAAAAAASMRRWHAANAPASSAPSPPPGLSYGSRGSCIYIPEDEEASSSASVGAGAAPPTPPSLPS